MRTEHRRGHRICVLGLMIAWGSPQLSQAQPLSVEEIVSLKRVTEAQMSPAGDKIAYLLSVPRTLYEDDDGEAYRELHVVDLDGNSRPYVSGKIEIKSAAWSADGEAIYFVAKREPEEAFTSLFRISAFGGEAVRILSHEESIKAIYPSPDGTRIAFLADEAPIEKKEMLEAKGFKAKVYEESVPIRLVWMLDLSTEEVSVHQLEGSASDLSWASDGKRYAVALAPTPLIDDSYTSRDIFVIDATSAKMQNRMQSVGKLGHFDWSPDGKRIAYVGSVDINDPSAGRLYVASSAGGERRELVPEYQGHVADLIWMGDDDIRYLGIRGLWADYAVASVINSQAAGKAPVSGPIIRKIHAKAGQTVVAAVADTPAHPPEVFVLRDGAKPKRLTHSNPIINDRILGRQEAISYQARDGLPIDAVLIHPTSNVRQRNSGPLILFIHGGPEGNHSNGWMSTYSQPAHALAGQGYTVAYPNYRGSTGRGVEFSKLGQHDYAEEEFNDIVDLKKHLINEGLAGADHVGISGGSYGGYATMWAASALSDEFAAAVAFVGISNQLSKFGTGDIPYEMYHVHSRAWPWEDWMWMLRRSPVYHAGKTRTPLLIMGGDKDPRVHPSQSLEMYRHVKLRTDTPVRLVIYPGEEHGNKHTAAQYDYALRFERWMNHYLRGPGGEPPAYELDHLTRLESAGSE